MKILVTGGSGFIGSHLTDRLATLGHEVVVLDQAAPDYPNPHASYLQRDICGKLSDIGRMKFDCVYHLAAEVGSGLSMVDPAKFAKVNSYGTANLIEALRQSWPMPRLIVASSATVYGEATYECREHGVFFPDLRPLERLEAGAWELQCPICGRDAGAIGIVEDRPLRPASVYGQSKLDTEVYSLLLGRSWGFPVIAFRPFAVFGPRQSLGNPYTGVLALFATWVFAGQPIMHYEDGGQNKSYIYIDDAIDLFVEALTNDRAVGRAFNMGTDEPLTIRGVAEKLVASINPAVPIICTGKYRASDTRHMWPSLDLTKEFFDWRAKWSFDAGIAGLVDWLSGLPSTKIAESVDRFAKAEQHARSFGMPV